jgi:hypothetical protein
MKKAIYFFLLLTIIFSCKFIGCKKKPDIDLPITKMPLDSNEWAVAKFQYSRLREEPQEDSKIVNYIPLGKVIKVLKKDNNVTKFENVQNYWYYIDYNGEKGWIFGTFLEIYNDYNQAFQKSNEILTKKK